MKNILGIFRGFPGLGRVVAGVSLLETLRERYGFSIKIITYLQGNKYLASKGYTSLRDASSSDITSIGLLPTNQMAVYINETIKSFCPDLVIIDGEPLILQSIKISYPAIKILSLLNPADVDNPSNNKEAMDYFNRLYSLSDAAIVHGLRTVATTYSYRNIISIDTILREEVLSIQNNPSNDIYCVLGGGTVNTDNDFLNSSISIANLCTKAAKYFPDYRIHVVCSSRNIHEEISKNELNSNVVLYSDVISPNELYSKSKLVVTRSGRNSLSELAYLGIPTISFVSGCKYRRIEQKQNIQNLNVENICAASTDISLEDFVTLMFQMISYGKKENRRPCGNEVALNSILNLLQWKQ